MSFTSLQSGVVSVWCSARVSVVIRAVALWLVFAASAQAFVLQDLEGERTNLLDYVGDGRWTMVMIWQIDCVTCEKQKPAFQAFHDKHKDSLARVVGVTIDGMEQKAGIDEVIERHDPSYPNLVAFTDVYRKQYKQLTGTEFRTSPAFLFFDPSGELRGTSSGYINFDEIARAMGAEG